MNSLRHAGIVAREIEESLNFYLYLGFVVVADQLEEGEFLDRILGFKKGSVRTIKMADPKDGMIELLHYKNPPSDDFEKRINSIGCSHIALTVDDLDRLYKSLRSKQVEFINAPVSNGKVKVAFCKDPNGVYLELVEEL